MHVRIAVTHEQARVSSRVAWVSEANDEMKEADEKRKKEEKKGKKNPWRGRIKCEEGGIFKWASSLLRLEYVTSGISLSLSLPPFPLFFVRVGFFLDISHNMKISYV